MKPYVHMVNIKLYTVYIIWKILLVHACVVTVHLTF